MQPIIKDIILSISDDVVSNLTQSFEKTYYGKMNYSSKNTILDSDNKLLKETIGFEIAFIHVITYFLAYSMSCSHEYMHILNILDTDKLFSWFKIKDNSMFLQLNDCNIPTEKEIYELINEHDKFIDKDVKKKLGQPNIYSLFMHWGISHLRTNGTMSFIVPQSIRSGLYFKNLREKMKELRIKSILHIDSRQNIFDRAEQAVFIICLQNKPVCNTKTRIQFINGNQNVLSEFSTSRSKLMMGKDNNYMFIINKKSEMYDVLEKP